MAKASTLIMRKYGLSDGTEEPDSKRKPPKKGSRSRASHSNQRASSRAPAPRQSDQLYLDDDGFVHAYVSSNRHRTKFKKVEWGIPYDIAEKLGLMRGQPIKYKPVEGGNSMFTGGRVASMVEVDFDRVDLGRNLEGHIKKDTSGEPYFSPTTKGGDRVLEVAVGETDLYLSRTLPATCRLARSENNGLEVTIVSADSKTLIGEVWYYDMDGGGTEGVFGGILTRSGKVYEVREPGLELVIGRQVTFEASETESNVAENSKELYSEEDCIYVVYLRDRRARSLCGETEFSLDSYRAKPGDVMQIKKQGGYRGLWNQIPITLTVMHENHGNHPFPCDAPITALDHTKRTGVIALPGTGDVPFHLRNLGNTEVSYTDRKEWERAIDVGQQVNFEMRKIEGKPQLYIGIVMNH